MPQNKLIIFDTTLRDGEQAPGIALTPDEKLAIARQLAKLRVDVIEAGFAAASDGDFYGVSQIARKVKGPVIASLARCLPDDIDRAYDAVRHADRHRIHVFQSTSPIHMERMLRMTPDEVMRSVIESVRRARGYTDDVEFSPQDATRSDPDFMIACCRAAVREGATTINIPDTVGFAIPEDYVQLLRRVYNEVLEGRDDVIISTHCHNDLGLAVANSLSAIHAGARQIEGAINGIGERAGNTSTEEIIMAVKTRQDHFGVEVSANSEEIVPTSRLVSRLTGYPVQFNKAVVGRNAFAHESGIHQHGVLRDRETYEIMDPTSVGATSQIVLGKHSGRAGFGDALSKLGIVLEDEQFAAAFRRFKEVADRKIEINERELRAIIRHGHVGADGSHPNGVDERGRGQPRDPHLHRPRDQGRRRRGRGVHGDRRRHGRRHLRRSQEGFQTGCQATGLPCSSGDGRGGRHGGGERGGTGRWVDPQRAGGVHRCGRGIRPRLRRSSQPCSEFGRWLNGVTGSR